MPFDMKNTPATFQHMINKITVSFQECEAYSDDVIAFGNTWKQHLERLCEILRRLRAVKLTVNLVKSDFEHAHVTYLGNVIYRSRSIKPVTS